MRIAMLLLALAAGPALAGGDIDPGALARLLEQARDANSSAVVVMHRGRIVTEEYFGQPRVPIEAMSTTKSVLNVAFARLLEQGAIGSLDQPVHHWFPEWNQGLKRAITLRHLLSHTSGLQNVRDTGVEIYPSPDFVQLALAAELDTAPGEAYAYNNKAVNLLPELARRATGQRLDEWLRGGLFRQLGIIEFDWSLDEAGHPHGMSGLQIHPRDLAKIGQLMLQQGRWDGRRLLPEGWVETSTTRPAATPPGVGLLWFVTPELRHTLDAAHFEQLAAKGVDRGFLDRLRPHYGRYEGAAYTALLRRVFGPGYRAAAAMAFQPATETGLKLSRREPIGVKGFSARGYLGQYLVVYPAQELVAVRMIAHDRFRTERGDADAYGRFESNVFALFEPPPGTAAAR